MLVGYFAHGKNWWILLTTCDGFMWLRALCFCLACVYVGDQLSFINRSAS